MNQQGQEPATPPKRDHSQERPSARYDGQSPMSVAKLGQHESPSQVSDKQHEFKTTAANSSRQPRGNSEQSIVQQPPKKGSFEHTETPSAMVSQDESTKESHSARSHRTFSSISRVKNQQQPQRGIIRKSDPSHDMTVSHPRASRSWVNMRAHLR